jgi:GDPmannose 4,6-dehydratase
MHMMLQLPEPIDLVVGTGESHSVREFLDVAFGVVGLDWHDYVVTDEQYLRPAEVDYLQSDPTRAREVLGWEATISFQELVADMVQADMNAYGLPSA